MWLYHFTVSLKPVWARYWQLDLAGEIDRIPRRGPLIAAVNHASFLDPWFLALTFPRPLRYLITDRWYYRSKVWEAVFRANGTVPLLSRDPKGTIRMLDRYLAAGEAVGIFPEGRISPDGKIRRFRTGVARLAALSAVPVIPLGMRGSFESLPRDRRWPRRGRVVVNVGRPMRFPGAPIAEPSLDAVHRFRKELFAEVCRLAGQEPVKAGR